jgi:hypothetical protein
MQKRTRFILALVLCASCHHQPAAPSSWAASADVKGHTPTMASSPAFAGAISSLTWNGKEFIDAHDHGRELQSAASFDGLGECYNPTEAGSSADGNGSTSTSRSLYFTANDKQIRSSTQMAFWTLVNRPYPKGCGIDTAIKVAQNTTNLSNHILTKHITIGYSGIENVVEYLVTFHVPEHHTSATFECIACYLTADFSSFLTYDPTSRILKTFTPGTSEQGIPVILSTLDSQYAVGIYCPDLPQSGWPLKGYGAVDFPTGNARKLKGVFHSNDLPAGDYSFRWYLVVGALSDVTGGMNAVSKLFHP